MSKLSKNERGFSAVELIMAVVIVALIGAVGYMVYENKHQPTKVVTVTKTVVTPSKSSNTTDPYAGWKSFSNAKSSFKYPVGWTANNGPGNSQTTIADATSLAFSSSAVTTSNNPGAQITLYLQLSSDNNTIGCSAAPCTVSSITKLSNSQLPGAVLALVNQTSGNGTKFTEYVVSNGNTKVGDTTINPVKVGSSNIFVFGQPYYTPSGGGQSNAARVTDTSSFVSSNQFSNLIGIVNSTVVN